ncbi:hypothetical protein PTKIN_Ptkin16aG0096300 [Pterospermum kingtungense]
MTRVMTSIVMVVCYPSLPLIMVIHNVVSFSTNHVLKKMHLWFHHHHKLHPLTTDTIFRCKRCGHDTSGFAYTCRKCDQYFCVRCALVSNVPRCEGHEHLLPYYQNYQGVCNACDVSTIGAFRCKSCNFNLHSNCLRLPLIDRHKYDDHPYELTYHDNNNYSKSHYCDICEEERNPNHWFSHCEICDNSDHPDCVLGKYSFVKLGSFCKLGDHHPHPLTFVKKVHYYPDCLKCDKLCLDLSLECMLGCCYIVHWECIKPLLFWRGSTIKLLSKDETSKQLIDGTQKC